MSVGDPRFCHLDKAKANTKLFKMLQLTAMHVMQQHYNNPLCPEELNPTSHLLYKMGHLPSDRIGCG
jgi:hypothetical protein